MDGWSAAGRRAGRCRGHGAEKVQAGPYELHVQLLANRHGMVHTERYVNL